MSLSVAKAMEVGRVMVEANRPFLFVGEPGCGKTDAMKQVAKDTGRRLFLSQPAIDDPTDYKGFAFFKNDVADFFPLGQIRDILSCDEPALWLIDDLGQAPIAVQNAIMQFVHYRNRNLNGKEVPECVSIAACSNGREHNAGVVGMTSPLKGRFITIVEVKASLESWSKWALTHGIDPLIVAYLNYRPAHLSMFDNSRDFEQSPTPRGWESVNELRNLPLPPDTMHTVITGAVGEAVATEFTAFADILKELPDLGLIEQSGDTVPIPDKNQSCYAVCGALAARGDTEDKLLNIMKYIRRMASEYKVLWSELWSQQEPPLLGTKPWTDWCLENEKILDI